MAKRVRELMEGQGLAQRGLAQLAGVSQTRVNEVVNDKLGDRVSVGTVRKIAAALGVELCDLLCAQAPAAQPEAVSTEPPLLHAKLDHLARMLSDIKAAGPSPELTVIESAPMERMIEVPRYGRAAAGVSPNNPARVEPEALVSVPARLKTPGGQLIALEVSGDSMEPLLQDGDTVVVWYPSAQPAMNLLREGALVVVTTEGPGETYDDVIKRYRFERSTARDLLFSENPAYEPIEVPERPVYVGQVRYVLSKSGG